MDQNLLARALASCNLNAFKYFPEIGSTNDEALVWATQNAKDMSLVVTDKQTAGKGRMNREWHSQPGHSLTFSLILKPGKKGQDTSSQWAFLAALALVNVLRGKEIESQIKWPNDVLVRGRKVAGILVENVWTGAIIDSVVVGVGVNLNDEAFNDYQQDLRYPATSLSANSQSGFDSYELLVEIVNEMAGLRKRIADPDFLDLVNNEMAFIGQEVWMNINNEMGEVVTPLGVERDGRLKVRNASGVEFLIAVGEIEETNPKKM